MLSPARRNRVWIFSCTVALLILSAAHTIGAATAFRWEKAAGYRAAPLNVPAGGRAGFTLMTADRTGVRWTNSLSIAKYSERQNLMNGAGVALGDFDGDGWCDIYLCNREGPNALYHNLGDWKFEEVAVRAGVACTNQISAGATFADINGDGRLDLLVTEFLGPNACFLNLGGGQFTNITTAAGLISKGGSTSQALGDLDGDGDLDLYINYFGVEAILRDGGAYSLGTGPNGEPRVIGRYARRLLISGGQLIEVGEPDFLYRNDGNAHFTQLNWRDIFRDENGQPMAAPPDFGLAAQIRDVDGDGFPDIYVCNDFQTPDRLWLNDGRGHFRAVERVALRNMSYASMGVDFGDIDRDGKPEFFTVEMLSRDRTRQLNQSSAMNPRPRLVGAIDDREEVARNALYWNRGDGTYAEIAYFSEVAASDWSWTPVFLDVDLDGFEDILVTNGHLHDVNDRDVTARRPPAPPGRDRETRSMLMQYPRLDVPNAAFRNRGDMTFESVAALWDFASTNVSHGMALADLDNDGDMDVVINCVNAPPLIYRNNSSAPRVAVRTKGRAPNTQGIGAKVFVRGGPVDQSQEIICGGRYLSGDDPERTFAARSANDPLQIEILWRDGTRSVIANAKANYVYEVDQAGASAAPNGNERSRQSEVAKNENPMFADVSELLNHIHYEEAFDDFARQPLLPKRLSQLGPGVAWYDFDDDGYDDLILGSGKRGSLAVYRNDGKGKFTRFSSSALPPPLVEDATGILGWSASSSQRPVLVGLSNYESGLTNIPGVSRFDLDKEIATEQPLVPASLSSTGPLALADTDGDGDLDLFVGGRVIPGRYPEAASSRLFRNENGRFVLDTANDAILHQIGLVNGAVFSDLNRDGQADLILACEWGPLRVLQNAKGRFRDVTRELGLEGFIGLWNGVTTGDLDGDGRMDIVAGNWGLNSFYNRAPRGPWFLYYGDFNGDGQVQLIEAYPDEALKKTVPWRDLDTVATGLPWLREKFQSHKAYAQASVAEILGERMNKATELRAQTLASTLFLNRGNRFEAVALPSQAQWSPAMGVCVGDMDGDGNEDVFLSQNFFSVRTEDNRLDAGRGLWLRGDGKGGLKAVSGQESGVKVYGEQRGCALSDYDGDGRIDLVVTQNGAATKLYRNVAAKPGVRVRLKGTEGNSEGIGAQVRLVFGQRLGPAREIHAGSGYWSQDSAVAVMAAPEAPTKLSVRWPGGKVTEAEMPKGARDVIVDFSGAVKSAVSN